MSRGGRTDLRRRRAVLEPKRQFVLFCEGRKDEPDYFRAIWRACQSTLIDVEIIPGPGVPMTVAERAADRAQKYGLAPRRRKPKNSFEKDDQVWAVFDRDVHPRFDDAVKLCERNGVRVARSNPCFELWLILHERDYDGYRSRHDVQKDWEALCLEYDRSGAGTPNYDDLIQRVEVAERRAEAQLQRRAAEDAPHGNPSTTAGQLTRAIREADAAARPRD